MADLWDLIVVGSGPAGATVARQASTAGMKVLLLEAGRASYAKANGAMLPLGAMLARTRLHPMGGLSSLVRGAGVGGTTTLYFACAWTPPLAMFARHGVSLEVDLALAAKLLPIQALPDTGLGPNARRLMDAANRLNTSWSKIPKLIHLNGGPPSFQDKWQAGRFVADAEAMGCVVERGATVLEVLHADNKLQGLVYRQGGKRHRVHAGQVVLAAGGLGSPKILRASGLKEVGQGFFCDPIVPIFGSTPGFEAADEYAMAAGFHDPEAGYMVADMALPASLYAGFTALSGRLHKVPAHRSALSLMVKGRDEMGGHLTPSGGPRKAFTRGDHLRLEQGLVLARRILKEAGARDIFQGPITSAHPGGTVPLGSHLDASLQTRIHNLFVCDCSVIPEPWGLPPTLTLVGLGLYLSRYLLGSRSSSS